MCAGAILQIEGTGVEPCGIRTAVFGIREHERRHKHWYAITRFMVKPWAVVVVKGNVVEVSN